MYPHLLKIHISVMLLVLTGNYLLATSIGDSNMAWFTVFAVAVGFVVVDRLRLVEISGWIANVILVGVLYVSMKDFVGGGSATKLVSVGNLLAYLQVTLYFQAKTPRLVWQIIVLGILQTVLAAIFNLNFEYSPFFLLYFVLAITTLFFQTDFQAWSRTVTANKQRFDLARSKAAELENQPAVLAPMLVLSRPAQLRNLSSSAWKLAPWLMVSVVFAMILFHSLPHSRQTWKNPAVRNFSRTGKSISAGVDVDGVVTQTNQLEFRARFFEIPSGKQVLVKGSPYFRGMALSKLNLENNVTDWKAPYDHIFDWSYNTLPTFYANPENRKFVRPVELEIILEPDSDPLLYSTAPMFRQPQSRSRENAEFCRHISALTRKRQETTNKIVSYVYRVVTLLDTENRPLSGWPYQPFKYGENYPSMGTDTPEYVMHTEIDRPRYKQLVEIADSIASETGSDDPIEISNALLAHFSSSNRYKYTLDYTEVPKDRTLDPVEDFVSNHRQGHCSMYASALTLMLRSQGIPARYVVGFYGGSYNKLTECYVVHGRHAHAWVEAYIPPEKCTQAMIDQGVAGKNSGAWLTLDPTPPTTDDAANEAFDLARSIWQDYVISPDGNKQRYNPSNSLLLKTSRDALFGNYFDAVVDYIKRDQRTQLLMFAGFLMLLCLSALNRRTLLPKRIDQEATEDSPELTWFGKAIAALAPPLARWMNGSANRSTVGFYVRLEKLLAKHFKIKRSPDLTQLEFSQQAVAAISEKTIDQTVIDSVGKTINDVTRAFYQARFSSTPLDKSTVENIENQILDLEIMFERNKNS